LPDVISRNIPTPHTPSGRSGVSASNPATLAPDALTFDATAARSDSVAPRPVLATTATLQ
jgi:hypothetical protein